jgi:hypothetical protein
MRERQREEDNWVLLMGFKAGRAHRTKSSGAKLGPEWIKGWRAAKALQRAFAKPKAEPKGKR